jgi:transcriptional regulator of heat shock response
MEQNQPEQRRAADQVFQQSLEHLEDILQEGSTEGGDISQLHTSTFTEVELDQDLIDIDLAALEDAVADIEKYLEEITKTQLG